MQRFDMPKVRKATAKWFILSDMDERVPDYWVVSDRVLSWAAAEFAQETSNNAGEIVGAQLIERPLAIRVSGARIAELRPAHDLRAGHFFESVLSRGCSIHDVGRAPIVPGWVNAHTHLAMAPLRGITSQNARSKNVVNDVFFQIESNMTAQDVRAFTRMGAYESALCGTLFVWDHYYHGDAVAQALFDVGLSGVVAPTLQDQAGPFRHVWEEQIESTLNIAQQPHYQQRGIFSAFGPHAVDTVSDRLLEQVGGLSRKHELAVHMHCAQSYEEVAALSAFGDETDDPFEKLGEIFSQCPVLMAHGLYLNTQRITDLVARDWILAYCPYSQLQFGFLGPLRTWLDAGGAVALGTDCVASNDALDVQRELALLSGDEALSVSYSNERIELLSKGGLAASRSIEQLRKHQVKQSQMIDSDNLLASADGRAFYQHAHKSNAALQAAAPIFVGTLANFLVLDENHPSLFPADDLSRVLAYGSTQGAIKWGVVSGKIVGQTAGWTQDWLNNEAYREARREAEARRKELFKRAGLEQMS